MEPKDPEDPEDPEFLARQPMLVFDGASASAGACIETLDGRTTATVTTLLDATGVPWRKGRPPKQPPLLRRWSSGVQLVLKRPEPPPRPPEHAARAGP